MGAAPTLSVSDGAVAVSAPGKVLLAGGYLVLDRAYTGLVFGLDARIHVTVQQIPTQRGVTLNEIVVQSPQFQDAVWEYGYRLTEKNGGIAVTALRADADLSLNRNPFVETTVSYALSYIAAVSSPVISSATVTILADNDYYSTPADLSNGSGGTAPRFHNFGVPISKAHKTGLGSSAALVTALTAALLSYYLPTETFDLGTELGKRRLHNLAQAAHCAAQGKVGSGFDVASAVYGSCLYRRFSPSILQFNLEPGKPTFGSKIRAIVDEEGEGAVQWDHEISKNAVRVPAGLRLVMCDVSHGSQTPGMVTQVLAWRKESPDEAEELWKQLHAKNEHLAAQLKAVAETSKQEAPADRYEGVKQCLRDIRTLIRNMSERSGVPIEPPEQTELLNACEDVTGVIGGVVPGAGGYDAISILVEDDGQAIEKLKELLTGWKFKGEGRVSMLGVREEMEGVRAEKADDYGEWLP